MKYIIGIIAVALFVMFLMHRSPTHVTASMQCKTTHDDGSITSRIIAFDDVINAKYGANYRWVYGGGDWILMDTMYGSRPVRVLKPFPGEECFTTTKSTTQ